MGQSNAQESGPVSRPGELPPSPLGPASSRRHPWVWVVALVILAGLGFWYFRGSHASTEAQGPGAPAGAPGSGGKGGGRQGGGAGMVVPVIVATSQRGDLPVYYNGLGNVTAFNTVTVRTRIDGQITRINFQEGQFVQQGADLVDIDSRPYQVQLEQAEGQ